MVLVKYWACHMLHADNQVLKHDVRSAKFVPSAKWPKVEPVFWMQGYAKSGQKGHKHNFYGYNRR
jgi:hypothetical protein